MQDERQQFSLSWLLWHVCIFGLALGFSRVVYDYAESDNVPKVILVIFGLTGGVTCWGALFGSLYYGRMWIGIAMAWALAVVGLVWWALLVPSVQ